LDWAGGEAVTGLCPSPQGQARRIFPTIWVNLLLYFF